MPSDPLPSLGTLSSFAVRNVRRNFVVVYIWVGGWYLTYDGVLFLF